MADESESNSRPSLIEIMAQLARLANLDQPISSDLAIIDVPVDSLTILEWLYVLEQDYGFIPPDAVYDSPEDFTFIQLYELLCDDHSRVGRDEVRARPIVWHQWCTWPTKGWT